MGDKVENDWCTNCLKDKEDSSHIFFGCTLAKDIWTETLNWWWIPHNGQVNNINYLWNTLAWFKDREVKEAWKIFIVAVLWTMWLSRNEEVFRGTKRNAQRILSLIKIRTKEWVVALGLISTSQAERWNSLPSETIRRSFLLQKEGLLSSDYIHFRFVDGDWKWGKSGTSIAGIWGMIKHKFVKCLMYFSVPTNSANPLEAEIGALKMMLQFAKDKKFKEIG